MRWMFRCAAVLVATAGAAQSGGPASAANGANAARPAVFSAADYPSLPGAKALAVVPGRDDEVHAIAQDQANDLIASVTARERCQALAAADETCEIVRLNDERITTGRDILEQVPAGPHPLFLWRFEGVGGVVYLAGSIHILKQSLYPLPRQVDAAFEASDRLVLEVNMDAIEPADLQRRTLRYAMLEPPRTLRGVVPEPLYQRLGEHLADYGTTPQLLDSAKPALVMNQIVISRLLSLGYVPDAGMESYFLARRGSRQVLELESLDAQLDLLFNQPMETQLEMLAETLDVEDEIEPLLAGMLVAWLSGDDGRFLELFTAQAGDSPRAIEFNRRLLDERNHTMAAGIRGFLEDRTTRHDYFVLVGAAHLVGERGVVNLLAEQGIRGQRLTSTDNVGPAPATTE